MTESNRLTPSHNRIKSRTRRAQRGQALIIALAVLFVLLFIGSLFVTRIARNLVTTGRSRDTQAADSLAKAGLQYCDDKLNNSIDGADWRPAPTTPLTNDPDAFYLSLGFSRLPLTGGRSLVRVSYDPHPQNPRGQFLKIEVVGRPGEINDANDPTVFVPGNAAPRLRRELIAYKQIGLTDYLRFVTDKNRKGGTDNVIGTPPIGRYVATVLGNPLLGETSDPNYARGISTKDSMAGDVLYGSPIRVNGDLTIVGDTYIYESPRGNVDASGNPDTSLQTERVEVSGKINLQRTADVTRAGSTDNTFNQAFLNQQIGAVPNQTGPTVIQATDDAAFNTHNGTVRDGSTNPGADGYTRSVSYLAPPEIDTYAEGSGVMRYRALTRDSGFWYKLNGTGTEQNTGQYGFGNTGIYVNNPNDRQDETNAPGVNGSYSLRADWTNPNAGFAQSYWDGPFYRAPGVLVELLGDRIRLTRSDGNQFLNPDGTPNPENNGKTLEIPLTNIERTNTMLQGTGISLLPFPHDGDQPPTTGTDTRAFGDKNSYGVSVVLFAEGNVRVKGVYGAITDTRQLSETTPNQNYYPYKLGRVHLTIVSGGTAYIEGNIVKGDGYYNGTTTVMERASTCAILAKQYVTVNTTMFMQPQNQTNAWARILSGDTQTDAFATELGLTRQSTDFAYSWGVNPSTYSTTSGNANNPSAVYLLVRHAAAGAQPALLNLIINPAQEAGPTTNPINNYNAFYLFNEFGPANVNGGYLITPETYLVGTKFLPNNVTPTLDTYAQAPNFEQRAFPLPNAPNTTLNGRNVGTSAGNPTFITVPGFDNLLRFQVDQTSPNIQEAGSTGSVAAPEGTSDYLLSAAAVVPLDIRIEALLYAQERSFFVIPGYSFNPDPRDSRDAYNRTRNANGLGKRPSDNDQDQAEYNAGLNPDAVSESHRMKARFPFYGEPLDVRITIFGAIAENETAKMGDQAKWMANWGYIPALYGSTGMATDLANPGTLETADPANIIPDDHLHVHDPAGYVPGDDRTLDLRTPEESLNKMGRQALPNDVKITRGLRMVYDPTLAMPFSRPTDKTLSPDSSVNTRKQRALRFRDIVVGTGTFRQLLPAMPRLPVCPDLLYAGNPDTPIGDDTNDTDALK